MSFLNALESLLAHAHTAQQNQLSVGAPEATRQLPVMGGMPRSQSPYMVAADGYSPQDAGLFTDGYEGNTGSYLQPSFYGPQTTQNADFRQFGAGGGATPYPVRNGGPAANFGLSSNADPFGWLTNGKIS